MIRNVCGQEIVWDLRVPWSRYSRKLTFQQSSVGGYWLQNWLRIAVILVGGGSILSFIIMPS